MHGGNEPNHPSEENKKLLPHQLHADSVESYEESLYHFLLSLILIQQNSFLYSKEKKNTFIYKQILLLLKRLLKLTYLRNIECKS